MTQQLDSLLNLSTENEVVEFKEGKTQYSKDKLGRYFSALSNEANLKGQAQAWFVIGVKNDRTLVGSQISDVQINELKNEIAQHTSPRANFINVHRVIKENKTILLFEIPATPKGIPMCWKGHRYGRDGESLGGLSDWEYEAIKSQTNITDWSAQIIEDATLNDLSAEALRFARKQYAEKNPKLKKEIAQWSDKVFLNKAKITIKGKITRAAILLLGKPEAEHYLNPATSRITWILKDKDNIEKDYEHFGCPLILAVEKVKSKIRNLKYRYLKSGTLFPDEVEQYDDYIIREALNNCIAHQDYELGGKILVVENENSTLVFTNVGNFIPASIEEVVTTDAPEPKYRNRFLADAMVSLNMIDTIGSGIKRMFLIQRNKFFPLPEYDLSNNKVQLTIIGKVLDIQYAQKLAEMSNLTLQEIIYLDKVAKHKILSDEEATFLKQNNLIEGRKPNFYISSQIADVTGEKASYIRQRGFKDNHYKKMILDYIQEYKQASKKEIDDLILDILPSVLDKKQKTNKVRNIVYSMSKRDKTIENKGSNRYPKWVLSLSKD